MFSRERGSQWSRGLRRVFSLLLPLYPAEQRSGLCRRGWKVHKTQATVDGSITLKNGGWRKLCGSGDCNLCSRQQAVDQARCDRLPGGAQGGWEDWTRGRGLDAQSHC